jgi:NAD(P)-dependent dehydrogenase (short-subunit alcohol dehydrogenase family)
VDLHLAGETAVIIGAATGIGRAIAEAVAREGARAAVVALNPAWDALAVEMQDMGVHSSAWTVDATDFAAVRRLADAVRDDLGPPHHLVYAAGLGSGKVGFPYWNVPPEDWDRILRVNLLGAVHAAHAFGPGMAEAGRGTMLFVGSVAGQIGSQTDPPYSAAKAALINFAQCAARDLAPHGVRVNTLSPGMVKTTLNRAVWAAWNERQPEAERLSYEEWAEEKIRRIAPLGRWQEPEEMAAMAVYLASPHARNITGQTLNVDGGQVMHS